MSFDQVQTLIIGGGQAGLAMSHMLSRRGCPHRLVERGRIAERWRSERWEGLCFQFPNWSVQLPDYPLANDDPDGFASGKTIADFVFGYADFIAAPVRCGVEVTALRRGSRGFIAETAEGSIEAAHVVVATGPYQTPVVPAWSTDEGSFFQVHASRYLNPQQLPPGAVLIVGAGASGTQIAEELVRGGRRVFLSVGHHRRMPRRYRGRDLIWWLHTLGLDQTPRHKRGTDKALPLITGAYGGHTIDFRELATLGVTLLGRVRGIRAGVAEILPDVAQSLETGDAAFTAFLDLVDAHVAGTGLDHPEECEARRRLPDPPCVVTPAQRLDLVAEGVNAVIWATGYRCDFRWIDMPIFDTGGQPLHRDGITKVPGLYFLGLPWLSKMNSSFLAGLGDDAARLADHIAAHRPCAPDCLATATAGHVPF